MSKNTSQNDQISQNLKTLGLHHSEITVYLYLLEHGLSSPPHIAKGTEIALTNLYHILKSLADKDLIEQQRAGKRQAYLASDPAALMRSLDRKKESLARILPDLRGLYTTQENKPKIRFYDGIEQVKELFMQILPTKELLGIASTKQLFPLDPKFFEWYRLLLAEKGVILRDILTADSGDVAYQSTKTLMKGFYEARVLPQEYENFPTDILIWDNNIALITSTEPVFGTILTNPALAKTFRTLFEFMWKSLTPQREI